MPPPRGLLTLAMLWIAAAFVATVGTRVPIQPTSTSYTPAVRTLLELLAIGACVLWPIGRLSCVRSPWPPLRVALDMLTLMVVLQVVLWPLQLVTYWPPTLGAAIDLAICGWMAAAGGALALGLSLRGWARATVSVAWMTLMGLGPLLDVLGAAALLAQLAGPCVALLELAPLRPGAPAGHAWPLAFWPWIPACCLWALVLLRPARTAPKVAVGSLPG